MNINTTRGLSFGKLQIVEPQETAKSLSRICNNPELYQALSDTLQTLDKATGLDTLYLQASTKEAVTGADTPVTTIRITQPNSPHNKKIDIRHDAGSNWTLKSLKELKDLRKYHDFHISEQSVQELINTYA